jgi:hypothetical protein
VKLLDFTEDQINLDRIPVCIQMVLPEIHSTINDISAAAGLRGTIFGNWNFDLSNTFGKNSFDVENTVNSSMRENSQLLLMQVD